LRRGHDFRKRIFDVPVFQIGSDRLVAAGDVVSNARRGNLAVIHDDAADGLAVAAMPVRAKHAADHVSRVQTTVELPDRFVVMLSEDGPFHDADSLRCFGPIRCPLVPDFCESVHF